MAVQRRWEAAVAAGESRVHNLARSLRGLKASFERNELGPADFHRKVADRLDTETATLSRMFNENCPPSDGAYATERLTYRRGQDRIHATIREVVKTL